MRMTDVQESPRRSIIVSCLGGFALLLLALSVFAVATQARTLSGQAEQSVQAVENLRVVSIARAELSVASRLAQLAPEETLAIQGGIDNARESLDTVEEAFDNSTSEEVRALFADFRNAVDAQATEIATSIDDAEALTNAEFVTGETFTTLADVMRAEHVEGIESLEAENDVMNLIATIASFVVAFVVPSVGLLIFQALRSAPRDFRKLQFDHDRLETRTQAMAGSISSEASELRAALGELPDNELTDCVSSTLVRFENIASLNGAPTSFRNSLVEMNEMLAQTLEQVDIDAEVAFARGDEIVVEADPRHLSHALCELVGNALVHGGPTVSVGLETAQETVTVRIIDDGDGLIDKVSDAVIDEREFELRESVADGTFGFGIVTARRSLEAMGGALRYERTGDKTHMVVSLPIALDDSEVGGETLPSAA